MATHVESPSERLYRAYWQDGSVDLFSGLGLVAIGIGWLYDHAALAAVTPALLVPLWSAFRANFVEPRLGYVRFDSRRREQLRETNVALVVIGALTLVLGIAAYVFVRRPTAEIAWTVEPIAALPAALVGLAGILAAFLFQIRRLAVYGAVSVLAGVAVALLDAEPGWSLLFAGLVTAASGTVLLYRFSRRYPRLPSQPE